MRRMVAFAFTVLLIVGTGHDAGAQPLAINPSAAASDVRNPSSTNPAAAASDIRNPSAINPSAAASQIPQPSGLVPSRSRNAMPTILLPPIEEDRIARPPRPSRAVQRTRRGRRTLTPVELETRLLFGRGQGHAARGSRSPPSDTPAHGRGVNFVPLPTGPMPAMNDSRPSPRRFIWAMARPRTSQCRRPRGSMQTPTGT